MSWPGTKTTRTTKQEIAEKKAHAREMLEYRLRDGLCGNPEIREIAGITGLSVPVVRGLFHRARQAERDQAEALIDDARRAQIEHVRSTQTIKLAGLRLAKLRQDPRGLKVALDAELALAKALHVAGADQVNVQHSGQVTVSADAHAMALDVLAALPFALQVLGLPSVELPRMPELEGAAMLEAVVIDVDPG